jgi:ubiquinone/menaquinone biosynthesis C-methylase UbiE
LRAGGGLHHLTRNCNTELEAIGLDLSERAIDFCCKVYVEHANLRFIRASALALPFPDAIFDVVVNVEAAHAYRDYTTFFSEAARILRPGGTFLFADHCQSSKLHLLNQHLSMAGLAGELVDITANILQACVSDGDRRRRLFRSAIPWYLRPLVRRRFEDAAALQGSSRPRSPGLPRAHPAACVS